MTLWEEKRRATKKGSWGREKRRTEKREGLERKQQCTAACKKKKEQGSKAQSYQGGAGPGWGGLERRRLAKT